MDKHAERWSSRLPRRRLLAYALVFAIIWGILFSLGNQYGQWLKVLLLTIVATTITTVLFSIGRRLYFRQRRRNYLRKKGVHMLFRK